MRWVWAVGSAAVAGAVVAVVLFLSDLETLSWIAGAGSFVIAAPALAVAIGDRFSQREHMPPSGPATEPGRASAETPPAAGEDRVVIELTTPWIRIVNRLTDALQGAGVGAVISSFVITGNALGLGDHRLSLEESLLLGAAMCGLLTVVAFFGGAMGRDLLVVDESGLTIVDKRWLRVVDLTRSIPWAQVHSVRVVPSGPCHELVVQFKDVTPGEDRPRFAARLYVASVGVERTALGHQMRKALIRFGGDTYSQ